MDGVDAALIRTDGMKVERTGHGVYVPYPAAFQAELAALVKQRGQAEEAVLQKVEVILTEHHITAVQQLLQQANLQPNQVRYIGFHGHTIDHQPEKQISWQMGDAILLQATTGIDVIDNFRMPDVLAGGQGAPLVPIYQHALLDTYAAGNAMLNIGGISNITLFPNTNAEDMLAWDTGPGNAMLNDWIQHKGKGNYDAEGALARAGVADEQTVKRALNHPFMALPAPKSLDRNDFHYTDYISDAASVEDGAATLTEITAATIAHAIVPYTIGTLFITGGGRHNAYLMQRIATLSKCEVQKVEAISLDGDMLEAEAFAYLAARKATNLPYSFAGTTGRSE